MVVEKDGVDSSKFKYKLNVKKTLLKLRLPRLSQSILLSFKKMRNILRYFSIDIQHFKTRKDAP